MGYCHKQNEDAKARLVKQRFESVGLAFSLKISKSFFCFRKISFLGC